MKEETKRMAERFSCEYQVFEKGGDPEDLEDAYFEALKEGKDKGFYPAILVVDEYVTEQVTKFENKIPCSQKIASNHAQGCQESSHLLTKVGTMAGEQKSYPSVG